VSDVNVIFVALLLSIGVLSAFVFASWRRRIDIAELGTLSARWLAEHRAHDRHERDR
jgi:hypothetical protein